MNGRPRPERAVALLLALVIVQAIFEPDYGSYVKHIVPALPLFLALLPLRVRRREPHDAGIDRAGSRRRRTTMTDGIKVLHVTDASSSGVLTAVTTIARQQSDDPGFPAWSSRT